MRSFLLIFSGILAGLYLSWPGLVFLKNWQCFNNIIKKSAEDKISLKVVLELSPSYLLKGNNKSMPSKMRIIADACFR